MDLKDKFTSKTAILTALISISFMIRNTSAVGWLPLLAYKVLFEGSFVPFLKAGIFIALPVLALLIWVDTVMYNSDKWVVTSYNFLEMNILHGLSKYFGEDPWYWYVAVIIPFELHMLVPFIPFAMVKHYQNTVRDKKVPYSIYYSVFYVVFFSAVKHKEERFLLPIW